MYLVYILTGSNSVNLMWQNMNNQKVEVMENNVQKIYNSFQIMIWLFLGVVTMLFAGFTSAYIVRMSTGNWEPISMPKILILNSIILIISSLLFELAKNAYKKQDIKRGNLFLKATWMGGMLFIAGQVISWYKLQNKGIYLATTPHSSFFYILTALHILHFLGGIIWLTIILIKTLKSGSILPTLNNIKACTVYWHYFTGLWVYLIFILFVFKI